MPYLYIQMPRTKSKNKISAVYCDGAKHGPYVTSLEHNAALLKLPQITNSVFAALPPPVAPRAARPLRSTSRRSSVASRCRPTPRSTVLSLYLSPHTHSDRDDDIHRIARNSSVRHIKKHCCRAHLLFRLVRPRV